MSTVLLVEDELMISDPLSIVMRTKSYSVDIAHNGLEALNFCHTRSYDIILLDIMMPVCNGVEFLRKAKLKTTAPQTKVILLTNLSSGAEIDEALQLGARKNVLKATITPRSLLELLAQELASRKQ